MKRSFLKRNASNAVIAASFLLVGSGFLQSCKDEALTGQPSWLGNSIYERLQDDGHYTTTLRLIDDLNYTGVLKMTGSKTLFVADDDAYTDLFKNNAWNVSKYADLTKAQKSLLLNNAMINNAYVLDLLSDVSGDPPLEGRCMRRATATSIYDSISRIYPSQMPNTTYWSKYKDHTGGVVLVKDNTTAPMIHFLPKYMKSNEITNEDLSIITNGKLSSTSDAYVDSKKVIESNITCKNGYIHKVDGVMMPLENMASVIRNNPRTRLWSRLLDRYSAPYYNATITNEYRRLYNTTDSVFVLKYFADEAEGGSNKTDPDGKPVSATLSFDPGWNQYIFTNTSEETMNYDCGAMLVPSDTALASWWENGGRALKEEFGSWDNVPDLVLSKLLNVNMISSFASSVPSKFDNIVNDAKVSLGVKKEDIDSCFIGCNGVVYMTKKVFAPAAYSSVSFPALIHTKTMNIIYWAINNGGFDAYLNSMDSHYSFIIPTNDAMLRYVDPCSYGSNTSVMYQFFYDNDKKTVGAHRFQFDLAADTIITCGRKLTDASSDQVTNRLNDLMNNLIVVGDIDDGNTYYKTKGGATIKVENAGQEGAMKIYGGLQLEQNRPLVVKTIYNQLKSGGNGKSYVVDTEPPLTGKNSVYSILQSDTCYSEFLNLINGGPSGATLMTSLVDSRTCVDKNIRLFDSYNYTVWVPSNDSIRYYHSHGLLPDWNDYEAQTADKFGDDQKAAEAAQKKIQDAILNFVRYHIQDNSLYLGGGDITNGQYETAKLNPANSRFYKLNVNIKGDAGSVTDNLGVIHKVITKGDHSNKMCREYLYTEKSDKTKASEGTLYTSSYAVVHLIDGPLFYDASQKTTTYNAKGGIK